jgi:MoxR-like ATPase
MAEPGGAREALREAIAAASEGLVEREVLVELVVLAAVAREHLLVVGPPGTAKSEAVRRTARALGGVYFEYLLGRFTEPSEIFGPVDLKRLREGEVTVRTAGMLPEAEIAFLDEVFLGSTAILNTLLGLLNERVFRRGHTLARVPLRVCVGASNRVPDDEALAAFADRFLLHVYVDAVPDPRLEELLEGGWGLAAERGPRAEVADLDALSEVSRTSDMSEVRPLIAAAVRRLRAAGVSLSDRRVVRAQRLVAAAAALDGRDRPGAADLWPLVYAVPDAEGQAVARRTLRDALAASASGALPGAAEEASAGPVARAARLEAAGRALLEARPEGDQGDEGGALETWRLKLEGVLREIDAGFTADALPEGLAGVRAAAARALER